MSGSIGVFLNEIDFSVETSNGVVSDILTPLDAFSSGVSDILSFDSIASSLGLESLVGEGLGLDLGILGDVLSSGFSLDLSDGVYLSYSSGSGSTSSMIGSFSSTDFYDSNSLESNTYSPLDILTSNSGNIGTSPNPYSEKIRIGERRIIFPNGGVVWIPIYADNPAYAEFENTANYTQQVVYSASLASDISRTSQLIDLDTSEYLKKYIEYEDIGIDTSEMVYLSDEISNLRKEIVALEIESSYSEYFDRVTDVNNSQSLLDKNRELQDAYNRRSSLDNFFTTEFEWKVARKYGPLSRILTGHGVQDMDINQITAYVSSWSSGDMSKWMAGGILYDAPRAGDLLYSPVTPNHTTRFLNLQGSPHDNGFYTDVQIKGNMHNYHKKIFPSLAGDMSFNSVTLVGNKFA